MANQSKQSQLHRHLPFGLFIPIICLLTLLPKLAFALPEVPPSNTSLDVSEPFYVLSDKSYGTDETAQIRLEAPSSYAHYETPLDADIRVYRISEPLDFLKAQPDLHRVQIKANTRTSAMPAVHYVWDSWMKSTRRSWQRLFSSETRLGVTKQYPELKTQASITQATKIDQQVQFSPLSKYPIITQIRYPLWYAKPIAPPKDTVLSGSSSNFIQNKLGNVMVPLGKLPAGLYLIEAMVANQRATTLLFVSNTVAITKSAKDQTLVWTTNRQTGNAQKNVALLWTDGVGVLGTQQTDQNGFATLKRATPEHSYLLGEDGQGGVFVSENFYYDSEVYNTKLYAFTDRPLYRASDTVSIKAFIRDFTSAQTSNTPASVPISYEILDPTGTTLLKDTLKNETLGNASGQFTLPEKAMSGGYEIKLTREDDVYSASFRVADYIKPHFDILLNTPNNLKTGQPIKGTIALRYPNGSAVKNAQVNISVRAQQLSMVDGQLDYAGMFPIQLSQQQWTSNDKGEIELNLPETKEPSRYIVTILASDAAAYRVKTTREILVERGITPYTIKTNLQFGQVGQKITFNFATQNPSKEAPSEYELIRLEDGKKDKGTIAANAKSFEIKFDRAGSYTVMLKDQSGNLLGATNYWVQGEGFEAAEGSVEIVFDKPQYKVGETANALVSFPVDINDALLTLERDNVEAFGLLSQNQNWFSKKKINNRQYIVSLPVGNQFTPNMTFSVLYQYKGEYVFQNAGVIVAQPQIEVAIKPNKTTYKPKEKVSIQLDTLFAGNKIPSQLAISVVDEMIYVLQPEIAPNMVDFFYHPRRNNVATTASLNFIAYDKSVSATGQTTQNRQINERVIKVLERPRREEKDTAFWQAALSTNEQGKATINFTLPDSLTRWRITVRAMDKDGKVGQKIAYIQTEQPYYLKWTGPKILRQDDVMNAEILAFNQMAHETKATWRAKVGATVLKEESITLKPGANYLSLPINAVSGDIQLTLSIGEQIFDALTVPVKTVANTWLQPQQTQLDLTDEQTAVNLPKDAKNIRLSIMPKAQAAFANIVDGLIEYPYGCVEQTSSRLIPLSMAYQSLDKNQIPAYVTARVRNQLLNQRLRLIDMAGENAQFSWWGMDSMPSLFISSYAYYADWYTAQALGLPVNADDMRPLLELYQKRATQEPVLHKMVSLWFMKQMGLPVQTLLNGVDTELANNIQKADTKNITSLSNQNSLFFGETNSPLQLYMALLISHQIHSELNNTLPERLTSHLADAQTLLQQKSNNIAVQSLLYLSGDRTHSIEEILGKATVQYPTFERAISLIWLHKAGFNNTADLATDQPEGNWQRISTNYSGVAQWQWTNHTVPTQISLPHLPQTPMVAIIRYDSYAKSNQSLPVDIKRSLYRLEPYKVNQDDDQKQGNLGFKAVLVKDNETLQSNVLYVDEITLTPKTSKPLQYGLVEVGMPTGASVESTTWGMHIAQLDEQDAKPFGNHTFEEGVLSYRLPVTKLTQTTKFRQLVRFSQKGQFHVPAVRLFNMYQPQLNTQQQATPEQLTFKVD
ncbi:alpha-2-macroglobulin family protein [Neisseria sp. Ec49-e6-T10]|uniref:alpha-2-macroglobulin family protein n=1 Tax=Neisseria sp. Ec49-e6-T10 TaxID=3140744 RepID=UPI003EB967C6